VIAIILQHKRSVATALLAVLFLLGVPCSQAQVGGKVEDFPDTDLFREACLEFYSKNALIQGKTKYDGYYYLSKKTEKIYLAELITRRGSNTIVSQSLHFPDDPKRWDVFTVAGFVNEAIGGTAEMHDILNKIRGMFREVVVELELVPNRDDLEESIYSKGVFRGHDIVVKRIPAGDWVVVIAPVGD
jgi:hypothetical protein